MSKTETRPGPSIVVGNLAALVAAKAGEPTTVTGKADFEAVKHLLRSTPIRWSRRQAQRPKQ